MQDRIPRVPNAARTARTRAQLLDAARALFLEKGYAGTGTPEIAARAGLTRGALYHNFADKRALFAAVVEAENAAVAAAIDAAAPAAGDVRAALRQGAVAYLAAMQAPGRGQLLLVEAPAALGAAGARESDARHGLRTLADGLAAAMAEGSIRQLPLEALTEVLGAAFDGAALALLRGRPEPEVRAAMLALIDGLAAGR